MQPKPALVPLIAALFLPCAGPAQVVPAAGDLPVIQKVQLAFSMVSHPFILSTETEFYNTYGDPAGSSNYAVPYLVCDPLITLYNPHPTPLTLSYVRIRFWDPPVGFRFKKGDVDLREAYGTGEFHGLARFQVANEADPEARKSFTFLLTQGRSGAVPGGAITLAPGETRSFSPRVETVWNWQREYTSGDRYRFFYDWDAATPNTNEDNRSRNRWGIDCLASVNPRAGFQWDHLSSSTRPSGTRYSFEESQGWGDGRVAILLDDSVTAEARPLRTLAASGATASEPDFRISLLARSNLDPSMDIHQDFAFGADSIVHASTGSPSDPVASRSFRIRDILQSAEEPSPAGKQTFATLTAVARHESLVGGELESVGFMNGEDHYHVRFDPVPGFWSNFTLGDDELTLPPVESPQVFDTRFTTDGALRMAVITPSGAGEWRVMGGETSDSLSNDLTDQAVIIPVPAPLNGPKLDVISIDAPGVNQFFALVPAAGVE